MGIGKLPYFYAQKIKGIAHCIWTGLVLDRVPVPVIAIQGRTLLQCKKGGSILKFEAPNLLIFFSWGVYKLVRHHEKTINKPWQFKYYLKMVLLGCDSALKGLSSTPGRKQGCLPALYGEGKGWLRWYKGWFT